MEIDFDPTEDLRFAVIAAQGRAMTDAELEAEARALAPLSTSGEPAPTNGGVSPYTWDDPGADEEPYRPLTYEVAGIVDAEIDGERLIEWLQETTPELQAEDDDVAGTILHADIGALATVENRILIGGDVATLRGLAAAIGGASAESQIVSAVAGAAGESRHVIRCRLDTLADVMPDLDSMLPAFIGSIDNVELTVEVTDGLAVRATSVLGTEEAPRLAVTGFEAARAAWSIAGLAKKTKALAAVIQGIQIRAAGNRLEAELVLGRSESRALLNMARDLVEGDDDDDDDDD